MMKGGRLKLWMMLAAVAVIGVLIYFAASAVRTIRSTQTTPLDNRGGKVAEPAPKTDSPGGPAGFLGGLTPGEAERFAAAVAAGRPRVPDFSLRTAADYRRRARFPESSHPIEGADPIQRERTPEPASQGGAQGAEPILTAILSEVNYEAPEPVVIYAYLTEEGGRVPAAEIRARLIHETHGQAAELELNDSGGAGDDIPGDYVYSGFYQPDPAGAREWAGSWLVSVRAVTREGEDRAVSNGFLYSAPDAHLTGRFRETLTDGSLRIGAEIEVRRNGRFHLEGSLYSLSDQPLAWAQTAANLAPGRHWLSLDFYGLALREKEVDGPYLLRRLALSTTTGMPNQKNRVLENVYRTRAYRTEQFTDQPYGNPDLLDAAERLEAEAARQ